MVLGRDTIKGSSGRGVVGEAHAVRQAKGGVWAVLQLSGLGLHVGEK